MFWDLLRKRRPRKPASRRATRPRSFRPQVEALEDRCPPATFVVTNNDDSGLGSFRQAILDANTTPNVGGGPDRIHFNLAIGNENIFLASSLPTITDPVVIDGTTQPSGVITLNGGEAPIGLDIFGGGSTVRGLAIINFSEAGIRLGGIDVSSGGNIIEGNFIGITPAGGVIDTGNVTGVWVRSSNNRIGGTAPGTGNVIAKNTRGVRVEAGFGGEVPASGNVIEGNFIGTDVLGTADLGNDTDGVLIRGEFATDNVIRGNVIRNNFGNGVLIRDASNNAIGGTAEGDGNIIANNGQGDEMFSDGNGVAIRGTDAIGNAILGNSIFENRDRGIELSLVNVTPGTNDGPNNLQNSPFLVAATSDTVSFLEVQFGLSSMPNTRFRIEFFSNFTCDISGQGEGKTFLGATTVTTDGNGNLPSLTTTVTFPISVLAGSFVTATATDSDNNTSEFSACLPITLVVPPPPRAVLAVGAGAGASPHVKVFDAATGAPRLSFLAYDPAFRGGVRVTTGDVNGDGVADIITGSGPGAGPHVKVFSGTDLSVLYSFYAYLGGANGFQGGIFVAAGDVNGDGLDDIITGTDAASIDRPAGSHVKVFSGADLAQLASFYAYPFDPNQPRSLSNFLGGVRVAAADVNGDGFADIITAPGPDVTASLDESRVLVIDGTRLGETVSDGSGQIADSALLYQFRPYDRPFLGGRGRFFGGVYVAGGDVDGDGFADIITGRGDDSLPNVMIFSGADGRRLADFFAFAPFTITPPRPSSGPPLASAIQTIGSTTFRGGVRVGAVDANGDGRADILAGAGPGEKSHVKVFSGTLIDSLPVSPGSISSAQRPPPSAVLDSFFAFDPAFTGGVFVGGG